MKPATLGAAAGVAAGVLVAGASRGPTLVPWPNRVRAAFPFALGGLAGAVVGIKVGVGASVVARAAGRGRGPLIGAGPVLVGAGVAAVVAASGTVAARRVLGGLIEGSRELDPAFAQPSGDPWVSGSAASALSVDELGREGARFVGTVTTPDGIREVTGMEPVAEPVRVFVGVDAATTPEQRVGLAMAELRRTGAFERGTLIVQAPAGTGYANSFPVDIVEVLTRGDCAAVAIGYGLLPSFLSLGKVALGARTQRLLLEAIAAEVSTRAVAPRIVLYGESLGAKVQEAAVPLGPADLDRLGVSAALWVGTPGGADSDAFHALCSGESFTVDRPAQLPAAADMPRPRPRVWFLEHDGDPVVRFRPALIARRPAWLPADGARGRNVPEQMTWKPGITFAEAFVDTMFATNVKPGLFESRGHDYRADLAAVTTAAYDLPSDAAMAARLEAYLRAKEIQRAELLGEA